MSRLRTLPPLRAQRGIGLVMVPASGSGPTAPVGHSTGGRALRARTSPATATLERATKSLCEACTKSLEEGKCLVKEQLHGHARFGLK